MLPVEIPFFYKSHPQLGNGGLPDSLPIDIRFDEELQMYVQKSSDLLKEYLHKVYEEGSLVDGSISNESGLVYVKKLKDFLSQFLMGKSEQLDVLEIGCGSGNILKELVSFNHHLIGIEPGNHVATNDLGDIRIIQDFFPSQHLQGKFDVIYSFLVLEHFENPLDFLQKQTEFLKEGGVIVFGVPNCEPFLEAGDNAMFIHEHYSYFTKESIKRLVGKLGFHLSKLDIIEGMIVAAIAKENSGATFETTQFNDNSFQKQLGDFKKKLEHFFVQRSADEVALYVGARALNLLFELGLDKCRLVDDNSEIHRKYLPALKNPIENFGDIVENPPKTILIFSRTFGDKIKTKCSAHPALKDVEILTINEI